MSRALADRLTTTPSTSDTDRGESFRPSRLSSRSDKGGRMVAATAACALRVDFAPRPCPGRTSTLLGRRRRPQRPHAAATRRPAQAGSGGCGVPPFPPSVWAGAVPSSTSTTAAVRPRVSCGRQRAEGDGPMRRCDGVGRPEGRRPPLVVAASRAPLDESKPPEWLKAVPFLNRSSDRTLMRVSLAVNCCLVLVVTVVALSNFFTANERLWNKWLAATCLLLKSAPAAAWASYNQAVAANPWGTSMAISGVTYLLADWTAQTFEGRHFLGINTMRLLRSVLVGALILGPFAHSYYHFQDFFFESFVPVEWGWGCVVLKIMLDQTLYAASYNIIFYMGLGMFALRDPRETWAEVKSVFWRLMKAGWKLWPIVHCFTYTVVPTSHKLLWVDTVEVAWVTFLSIVANEKKRQTDDVIMHETQQEGQVQTLEAEFDKRSEELMVEAQVREMIEQNAVEEILSSMDARDLSEKQKAAAQVVGEYLEERKHRKRIAGVDPGLALLTAIETEDIVQSEVANAMRKAGMDGKSIDDLESNSAYWTQEQKAPARLSGSVQAAVAEHLRDISLNLHGSVKELAREAALEEVARVAQTMEDEKDLQIEMLKEELSKARAKVKEETGESDGSYDRGWMGP